MKGKNRIAIIVLFFCVGLIFNFISVNNAIAGTYSYHDGKLQIITDPVSQTGTVRFNEYPILTSRTPSSINSVYISVNYLSNSQVKQINGPTVTIGASGLIINGEGQILPDTSGYRIFFQATYTYWDNASCMHRNDSVTYSFPDIAVTPDMWNRVPSLTLNSDIMNNKVFSDMSGYNQLAISGIASDADNDNLIVSVRVKKGTDLIFSQDQSLVQCGGTGKPFSFLFTIDETRLEGAYTIDLWANDGK